MVFESYPLFPCHMQNQWIFLCSRFWKCYYNIFSVLVSARFLFLVVPRKQVDFQVSLSRAVHVCCNNWHYAYIYTTLSCLVDAAFALLD